MWTVRPATPADAPAIGWVHVASWQSAYVGIVPQAVLDGLDPGRRGADWLRWLVGGGGEGALRDGGFAFVAERADDGAIGGFVAVRGEVPEEAAGVGDVRALYADPTWWGTGAGHMLLEEAERVVAGLGCTEAVLWVLEANGRARRFYEAHGWAPDGARQDLDFDGAPVPEVRYRRRLDALSLRTAAASV